MPYTSNYQNSYPQGSAPQTDGALGWDDEIQKESSFTLLPEGDYWFTVTKIDKGRHEGSTKISACPKAVVCFTVEAPDGTETAVTENFLLHQKMEWKLSQFFASIGMKQKGEKLRMNWSPALIGKKGICRIIVHEYTGNDGQKYKTNRIEKLYPSYEQPVMQPSAQPQQSYTPPPAYQPTHGGWNGGNR